MMNKMDNINGTATKEFQEVRRIISLRRSRALQTVNNENLLAAWEVRGFCFRPAKKFRVGQQNRHAAFGIFADARPGFARVQQEKYLQNGFVLRGIFLCSIH